MKKYIYLLTILSCFVASHAQTSSLPIILSIPFDQDTIEEKEPDFVWQTNLNSIQNDPRLQQQIVVVKLEDTQTKSEAIVQNEPIFINTGLTTTSIKYSSSRYELEDGATYAWQVNILNSGVLVQSSEVYEFTIGKQSSQGNYLPLRLKVNTTPYVLEESTLKISLVSVKELSLNCTVKPEKGQIKNVELIEFVNGEALDQEKSISGNETRYFELDLKKHKLKKGKYTLLWSPVKGENYELLFERK